MMVTFSQAVVAYTFNPTQHSGDDLCESKAILAYRVGSQTARATQRNQVSKNQSQKKKKKSDIWFKLDSRDRKVGISTIQGF